MSSKKLNLKDYDMIAIDMDNTLVKYKLSKVLPLSHGLINKFMIELYDYPKEINEDFHPELIQKGLVIDKRRGNILKFDSNFNIIIGKHGNKKLTNNEINVLYNELTEELREIPEYLSKGSINSETDYYVLKDYFSSPSAQVFAKVVEVMDSKTDSYYDDYETIWSHIYTILCLMYDRKSFKTKTGGYFEELINNPKEYLEKSSEEVKKLLISLRKSGKLVVLITSSNIDYTKFLMNHTFDQNFVSYFDCVLTFARKPTFFTSDRPFLLVDENDDTQTEYGFTHTDLECGKCYSEGNWNQLKKFVSKITSKSEPNCVYIGDSFNDDCIVPNRTVGCDTIAIVEELEESIRDELNCSHWKPFCDQSNNIWYHLIEKHSRLIVESIDVLAKYHHQ